MKSGHCGNSRLLEAAGDRIDNAIYTAICAVLCGVEDAADYVSDAILALAEGALLPSDEVRSILKPSGDLVHLAWDAIEAALFREGLKPGDSIDWNMELIASVTEAITATLRIQGTPVCHPWQDGDGKICHSTDMRCQWCKH